MSQFGFNLKNKKNEIIILGGHKLALNYLTKISEAKKDGFINYQKLSFVDENKNCVALKNNQIKSEFINSSYSHYCSELLKLSNTKLENKILIPDHTAPHVLFKTFIEMIKNEKWKNKIDVSIKPVSLNIKTPYEQTFDSKINALSFATWVCPLECEEPDICPAIKNKRDWNFDNLFHELENQLPDSLVMNRFFCHQLVFGISYLSFSHIKDEYLKLKDHIYRYNSPSFIVATYSKCHAILGQAQVKFLDNI